jgi:hypothetical protein
MEYLLHSSFNSGEYTNSLSSADLYPLQKTSLLLKHVNTMAHFRREAEQLTATSRVGTTTSRAAALAE